MATDAFSNPVISLIQSPPTSPSNGNRYLISSSGTSGAFVGKENQVAERIAGAWIYSGPPASGQRLMVGQLILQYNAGWKLSPSNVFETVTALLAATSIYGLADGASWRCAGRTNPGDGGGCIFVFDAADTSTPDNDGTVRVDSVGHRLKAEIADPRQLPAIFGMKADHGSDDRAAFQAMVDWAFNQQIRDIYLPSGAIALSSTVFIPYGIMLHGQLSTFDTSRPSTRIITLPGASYIEDFMIGYNTSDNINESAPGNYFGGGIENVCFLDEGGLNTAKGVIAFGNNLEFKNVGGRYMKQVFKRPDNPAYTDNLHLINPYYSTPADPAYPQFEISGAGDGLIIEGGNFPPDQSFAIDLARYGRSGAFGGVVRQCINGSMRIDASNITIDNWHAENSYLWIGTSSHVLLINSNISQNDEMLHPSIQMVDSQESSPSSALELNNVTFRWMGPSQFYSPSPFDISIGQQSRLVVNNSRRNVNGRDSGRADTGIRIGQDDNITPVPLWEQYSDLLSCYGEVKPGYNVVLNHIIPSATGLYQGPWSADVNPTDSGSWKIALGTYYYTTVRMYDVVNSIGATGVLGEVSVDVKNTSTLVGITNYCAARSPGAGPVQGMTRIYRGIVSGSYNFYADVPVITPDPANIVDDGHYIGGVLWRSRIAGGIDAIYPPDLTVPWRACGMGLLENEIPIMTSPGNAAVTLRVASDQQVIYSAPITTNRAVTLPALGRQGDRVLVSRTAGATGGFGVTIAYGGGSTTLSAPARVASAEFIHDGTNWFLAAQSAT